MTFTQAPGDQPDWIGGPGAGGDILTTLSLTAPGSVATGSLLAAASPSTLFFIGVSDIGASGYVLVEYFESDGVTSVGLAETIYINGQCSGAIIIPNYSPVFEVGLNMGVLPSGTAEVKITQCGIGTDRIIGFTTGTVMNGIIPGVAALGSDVVTTMFITAGRADLSVFCTGSSWSAVVYGFSATNDIFAVCGSAGTSAVDKVSFTLPPDQCSILFTNDGAAPVTFVYALTVG